MKKYEEPKMEVIEFENTDVLITSDPDPIDGPEL